MLSKGRSSAPALLRLARIAASGAPCCAVRLGGDSDEDPEPECRSSTSSAAFADCDDSGDFSKGEDCREEDIRETHLKEWILTKQEMHYKK